MSKVCSSEVFGLLMNWALCRKAFEKTQERVLEASVEQIREFVPYSIGRVLEE